MMNRLVARVAALALLVCLMLLSALGAAAQGPTPPPDKAPLQRVPGAVIRPAGLKERVDKLAAGPDGRVRAILQLSDPPLAEKFGRGSARPALDAQGKLDLKAGAVKAYTDQLAAQHKSVAAALAAKAPGARVDYTYSILYNGLAVAVPADKAAALADLPGVQAVHGERMRYVTMDVSLPLIGAPAAWAALGGPSQAGAGVKVAIVDTGIRKENPLFAGDGYSYPADGGPWPKGYCADTPDFCNGKIISARFYTPTFPVAPNEVLSPLDIVGHGSHTAGTAAGNQGVTATFGPFSTPISGVAPRAWLMVYKGLFATEDGGGGGSNAMLVAALEDAVRDGADVINNSWGGSPGDPTGDPDTVAAENAVAAGVVVVFSAGNSGPGAGSLGTPGNTPGVITVGATTTTRTYSAEVRLTSGAANPVVVTGASIGTGASGPFVDAEGVADENGDRSGLALNPYPAGTFTGQIVLVKRGENARVAKSHNVAAGGAVGMVLYNATETDNEVIDFHPIPTVHVALSEGLQLKRFLAEHPGATATLAPGAVSPTAPDVLAAFSARGPNFNPELVKPDVVAPGVNIVSAYSPDNLQEPTPFLPASGTSMAAPHVAGAAALILQKRPTFTPQQVKSALMTTATTTGILREDGVTPASVNDRGAGRIDVSRALDPGITFDRPSVGISRVLGRATREVRATNVSGGPITYTAAAVGPVWGSRLTVTPSQFTLQAGQSISLTIGVNVIGLGVRDYDDGQINFTEVGGARHAHLITWLRPAPPDLPREVQLDVRNDAGDAPVTFTPNVDLPSLSAVSYGLAAPVVTRPAVIEDPDSNPTTNPLSPAHGWTVFTYTLTTETALFQVETSNPSAGLEDADLFLVHDANGNGRFDFPSEVLSSSRGYASDELVKVDGPAPGLYAVALHGYAGQGAVDMAVWDVRSGGNLSVTLSGGPVVAGTPYPFRLAWRDVTQPGVRYLGAVRLLTDEGSIGLIPVRLTRAPETELTTSARPATVEAGRPVTYTFSVTNFESQATDYTLTDTLPAALRLDPASLTGWTVVPTTTVRSQFSLRGKREAVEFQDSAAGHTPPLRYIDLPTEAGSEELPQGSSGDDVGLDFELPAGVPAFTYLGQSYTKFGLVTNGYIVPGGLRGPEDVVYVNRRLPNLARPNPMIAPFWTDLDLGAGSSGSGTWYADVVTGGPFGANHAAIIQWKDAGLYGSVTTRLNFEVVLVLETGEIYFVYDKMDGDRRHATIGAEDATGEQGGSWYFDGDPAGRVPTSDRSLKLLIDTSSARFATQTMSFRARPMAAGTFTDTVTLTKSATPDRAFASNTVTATAPEPVTVTATADPRRAGYASPLLPGPVWLGDVIRAGVDPTLQRPAYYGLFQLTAPALPSGAQITRAEVTLTGHDATYFNPAQGQARWQLRLLAPGVNSQWGSLTWHTARAAPVAATLAPTLTSADLGVGRANTFSLAPAPSALLSGGTLSFRVDPELLSGDRRQIFGWDGGAGGHPPRLSVTYIPPIVELP